MEPPGRISFEKPQRRRRIDALAYARTRESNQDPHSTLGADARYTDKNSHVFLPCYCFFFFSFRIQLVPCVPPFVVAFHAASDSSAIAQSQGRFATWSQGRFATRKRSGKGLPLPKSQGRFAPYILYFGDYVGSHATTLSLGLRLWPLRPRAAFSSRSASRRSIATSKTAFATSRLLISRHRFVAFLPSAGCGSHVSA